MTNCGSLRSEDFLIDFGVWVKYNACMKRKAVFVLILLLALAVILTACKDASGYMLEEVVSLVDEIDGYKEIKVNNSKNNYDRGEILAVFENGCRVVYLAEGSRAYNGTLIVAVLVVDDVIAKIAEYESNETQNYGTRIFKDETWHLSQYYGMSVKRDSLFTIGSRPGAGDVVALSGATVTCSSVMNAINAIVNYVH